MKSGTGKFAAAASIVSIIGLADAVYLTVSHYTAAPVPCSIIEGCEKVLTSAYAEIGGVPLALFGAVAYFAAFALSILTAFGNHKLWKVFGAQTTIMALFTVWLVYLQAAVIGAFCQFCILSAATTFVLFLLFIISFLFRRQSTQDQ